MSRYLSRGGLMAVAVAGLAAAGCASVVGRVPVAPAQGQSENRMKDDAAAWQAAGAERGRTGREEERRFAACMIARSYQVSLPARVGVSHARFAVTASGHPTAGQTAMDVTACEKRLEGPGVPSALEVVAGSIGGVAGGEQQRVSPHGEWTDAMRRQFSACMTDRGYVATPRDR